MLIVLGLYSIFASVMVGLLALLNVRSRRAFNLRDQMINEILNNSQSMIYAKDLDGRYVLFNTHFERALGLPGAQILGRTDHDLFPREYADKYRISDEQALSRGECVHIEETAAADDGVHTALSLKFPIRDRRGQVLAVGGISTDVTEARRNEIERAELLVREKAAVEASSMKSIFLANMSHELRTPINGVMGMADLMRTTTLSDEQRSFTEAIFGSAESLLTLVNDILDLSKAEAGKVELESVDVDLRKILMEVERTVYLTARQKGLHLDFSIDADVSRYYLGDPTRLRQVLMNLANNAIKFTEVGEVNVLVKCYETGDGISAVRFEVRDSGIGIPQEAVAKLFAAFSQADTSTTRKFGGSGLGLSISKHLVTLMGGDIGVEAREGGGSEFWFWIPLLEVNAAIPRRPVTESRAVPVQRSLRVLIVEDNKTNQVIAAKMLQKLGHRTEVVENGVYALAALNRADFDLIFMDCQMPEMDGYEATRAIRKGETLAPIEIPIIALTANAMRGDREKCHEAGMTDYISKPLKSLDLENAISRLLVVS